MSICFVLIIFLNLPFFYELSRINTLIYFIGSVLILSTILFFYSKGFILSILDKIFMLKNVIYNLIISIILFVIIFYSSINYWSVPQEHKLEICFTSDNQDEIININQIYDFKTKLLYPAKLLGDDYYPIIINHDECKTGYFLALLEKDLLWEGVTVVLEGNFDNSKVDLGFNTISKQYILSDIESSNQQSTIRVDSGTQYGNLIEMPWAKTWFTIIRWLALAFGSVGLSIILFGFSETLIRDNLAGKME